MIASWLRTFGFVLMLSSICKVRAAAVTWDGGGGNLSWQNATNWSGNTLPGAGDDVIINVAGNITVTSGANVAIRSLQCSNHLAVSAGTFRVGGGSSVVQGQFTLTGTPILSATGAVTEFKVVGPVSADGAGFEALSGAKISLPNLTNYVRGFVCFNGVWEANGAGSVLDFSGLTNFSGGTCAGINANAVNGGKLLFANLTTIADGSVSFLADGVASLIDLPALENLLATFRPIEFEARNGGTVSIPSLRRGETLAVTLNPGATLPVGQMDRLVGITVNGGNVSFPALTNFTDGSFNVSSGAVVTAPNLVSYQKGTSCAGDFWTVSGSNSVLNLPALISLTGGTCTTLEVRALNGGTVLLTNVASIIEGNLVFLADGANSLVDLRALQESLASIRAVSFEARNSGTMWVPLLAGGRTVEVALRSNGTLPVAQMRLLGAIAVNGLAVSFTGLTNLDAGSIMAENGAVVSAPILTAYNQSTSCAADFWTVTGAGSVLDLPGLVNLSGGTCVALTVRALGGGVARLTNVTTLSDGMLAFLADGVGSAIDLRTVQQSQATSRSVDFEIRNGGSIAIPQLPGGPTVRVALAVGGTMAVSQMRVLNGISVGGRAENFPVLTNFNNGSFAVTDGAVVSAPNLTAYDRTASCGPASWTVNGSNSVLSLPALTGLTGGFCAAANIQALAGGTLLLTNLASITEGFLSFLADGTNSLIDLRALQQSQATLRSVAFEARNGGTVQVPLLIGGPTVEVTLKPGGVLPAAQMRRLRGITISGVTVPFPGLTNFDGGFFSLTNAAVVSAPNLLTYTAEDSCVARNWLVSGTGSTLDLSGVRLLIGKSCEQFLLRAFAGGDLLLGSLANIPSGNVGVISDGAGSLVDLHSLTLFINTAGLSSLNATNGGIILLNEQPLIVSGVGVNLPAGIVGPGSVTVSNSSMALAAEPWRSYWVESRNPSSPTNPWTFFRRVPLTSDFQVFAPRAEADLELRAYEFIADPYLLDLDRVGANLQLILYAPTNRTLEVQSASNLTPVISWQTIATVAMTNTFRLFPPAPPLAPQRHFRARTL